MFNEGTKASVDLMTVVVIKDNFFRMFNENTDKENIAGLTEKLTGRNQSMKQGWSFKKSK